MPLWLFAFLAAVAIVSALGVVVQRKPVHCLLALALTLTDLGALFVGLGAVTVGFLQIIIYVGAIMVLFLFVIWLLNLQTDPAPTERESCAEVFECTGRGRARVPVLRTLHPRCAVDWHGRAGGRLRFYPDAREDAVFGLPDSL
jgi:hypothetical protein